MVAHPFVVLLVDIGNTYTHAAVANGSGIVADAKFTSDSLALGPKPSGRSLGYCARLVLSGSTGRCFAA
ncbi:MAG: hypothetical protein CM1200mP29_13040 [Verrucomicrobiota bacterium]|nr:MAG: hypothetical protein CM1200mP29_13040 [Verrucomicrobiota bacterium]